MNKHEEAIQKLDFMNDEYNKLLERFNLSGGFGNWYLGVKRVLKEAEATEIEHKLTLKLLDEANRRIDKTEKELEIYMKLHQKYQYLNENTNDYDLNVDEVDNIHNEIYELEEKKLEQVKKMEKLQTNGLTLEQELERYKSWLEDLHIRYDELKKEHSATEKAYEHLKREIISISRIREPLNREIEFDNLIEKLRGVEND